MCDSSMIPLVLSLDKLKEELKKRNVFFQESYSREMLVHMLEMDVLFRSKRISCLFLVMDRGEALLSGLCSPESDCI